VNIFMKAAAVGAVAATLALTGVGAAGASTARIHPNGTPSCGGDCLNVSNLLYGPAQVINGKANGKVVLRHASDAYPFEDVSLLGGSVEQVKTYEASGLIKKTSYAYEHYKNHFASEFNFSPYGVNTGLCIGVATSAFNGEGVTKQACGLTAKTLWIFDPANQPVSQGGLNCLTSTQAAPVYCPVIQGSDANFSIPEALTAVSPTGQLQVQAEHTTTASGALDSQQFTWWAGVTP
jgi:hypothetical protein